VVKAFDFNPDLPSEKKTDASFHDVQSARSNEFRRMSPPPPTH
jgi:hypothetical protein